MSTKVLVEFQYSCPRCGNLEWAEDEGQHVTIFSCTGCSRSGEVRHRPDPDPLPKHIDDRRVATILSTLDAFGNAALLMPVKYDLPWLQHVHQSAQDTINYLFGYQGRKTIMVGRRKFTTAAVAPNGRAAVL